MLYNYVTTTNDTSILTRALPLAEVRPIVPARPTPTIPHLGPSLEPLPLALSSLSFLTF